MERPSLRRQLNLLLIGLLIGAAFTIIIAFGLPESVGRTASTATPGAMKTGVIVAPQEGALAPAFSLPDLDGHTVNLRDFEGQVLLLNFWAVWCGPCLDEMPMLQARYNALKDDGLVVLGINFGDPAEDVRIYRDALELSFPILLDSEGDVQDLYRIRGYPSSVLIDREGIVRIVQVGLMDESQLENNLEELGF